MTTLIEIKNLQKHFDLRLGAFGERAARVHALDDFTADIMEGETLSLVGESGCGKSTTGFAILNLHRPTAGTVTYKGTDLSKLDEDAMRPFRRDLQIVFQDPYSTLNPRMTIGEALSEPIIFHKLASKSELPAKLNQLLTDVGLTAAFASRYPHELSGGQRQRVAIARALACQPRFIVCDEAISALDVSVQAQILNLLLGPARQIRPDLPVHRPRPRRCPPYLRPRRRHVPRPPRRTRAILRPIRHPPAPLHPRAAVCGPRGQPPRPPRPPDAARRSPQPHKSPQRLPLPHPLPHRPRSLQIHHTRLARSGPRP